MFRNAGPNTRKCIFLFARQCALPNVVCYQVSKLGTKRPQRSGRMSHFGELTLNSWNSPRPLWCLICFDRVPIFPEVFKLNFSLPPLESIQMPTPSCMGSAFDRSNWRITAPGHKGNWPMTDPSFTRPIVASPQSIFSLNPKDHSGLYIRRRTILNRVVWPPLVMNLSLLHY